jgi:PPOX class probable F420-dependent enzyme
MSQRKTIQMTAIEVNCFLADPRVMSLATTGPNGRPHLVAMWYAWAPDGRLAFTTYSTSQKIKNLERNSALTALVEDGEQYDQLRGVQLLCDATLVDDRDIVHAVGESIYQRYRAATDGELTDAVRSLIHAGMRKRTAVLLDVVESTSWDHAKLGANR